MSLGLVTAMSLGACGTLVPGVGNSGQVPDSQSGRTIEIKPGTRFVNVTQDETVRFVSRGRSFTWHFNNVMAEEIEMQSIAPAGFVDHPVRIYVAVNIDRVGGPSDSRP